MLIYLVLPCIIIIIVLSCPGIYSRPIYFIEECTSRRHANRHKLNSKSPLVVPFLVSFALLSFHFAKKSTATNPVTRFLVNFDTDTLIDRFFLSFIIVALPAPLFIAHTQKLFSYFCPTFIYFIQIYCHCLAAKLLLVLNCIP